MQGTGEQESDRGPLGSPSNWSKVSDSTYVLGLDEIESIKNEISPRNHRKNTRKLTQVSAHSSSFRSYADSIFGDEHRQLLGGHQSASPVTVGPTWGVRTSNCSSISSSTGRSTYRNGGTGKAKLRRRAVLKSGECNVLQSRVAHRKRRYLQDIFTTLLDMKWRWTLLVFTLSFILTWLGFAVLWWLIAFAHGDFEPDHLPDKQAESGWKPCVYQIYNFASCFLFSIETEHTIGYGSRSTSEECPEAIFVMCIQSVAGVVVSAFMMGIVFAKLARPKQRTQTLLFSRNAVVCQRDGELCLMFRVGDMRKSHIICARVRAQLIRTRTTREGEVLHQYQANMQIGTESGDNNLFFMWPLTLIHRINSKSPLYNISPTDLIDCESRFEIILILEGNIESTGQATQARSSYLPSEVLWGHRFQSVVVYNKEQQGYEVDYSHFDRTDPVDTPLCSARQLKQIYQMQQQLEQSIQPDRAHSQYSDNTSSTCSSPARLSHTAATDYSLEPSPKNTPQLGTHL